MEEIKFFAEFGDIRIGTRISAPEGFSRSAFEVFETEAIDMGRAIAREWRRKKVQALADTHKSVSVQDPIPEGFVLLVPLVLEREAMVVHGFDPYRVVGETYLDKIQGGNGLCYHVIK